MSLKTLGICALIALSVFFFTRFSLQGEKHVICQVGSDSKVRSFEVVGDTAVLTIEGRYEEIAFKVIDNLLSRGLINQDSVRHLNGRIGIPNELGYSSTIKIPVKGIKHPVILANNGWETLDTISPCQSIAMMVDSAGRVYPVPAYKQ
jgi:hypothetical protein